MSCLDGMGLSCEQQDALSEARPKMLVAAGAGSGKTRLLVAYFVRALVEEGVPADRLVAVTFTRKAAAELTARIRSALSGCGREDLVRSLDSAMIGTIHSLCRRLIKERVLDAGVDPTCTVLEVEAARVLKEEASRRAWEQVLQQVDEAGLEVVASGGDTLRKEMVALYDHLRGMGHDRPQVAMPSQSDELQARTVLADLIRNALAAGCRSDRPSRSLVSDLDKLRQCLEWLDRPEPLGRTETELETAAGFFPSRRTPSMESHLEPIRRALTRYRCVLAERRLRSLVETTNALLAEFHSRYEALKRERGLLDFADLELRAKALVSGVNGGSAASQTFSGACLLVDEFQDTNELQCSILEGLGASRMLMVGDERQSIYRFRGADVAVFRDREDRLGAAGARSPDGGLHRLDVNYRSRPEILDFLNRLFSQEDFFGTRHSSLRKPGPGQGPPPCGEHPGVEVLLAHRDSGDPDGRMLSIQEAEAVAVADRVRRLIDEDKRRPREIVVLLPAQTHVQRYRDSLRARGVEVYIVGGKGYYSQEEVADVVSLLRILVNPGDDLALFSVLRSPLVGISDDGLYLLGRERRGGKGTLWETVRSARLGGLSGGDGRALSAFLDRYADLRRRVGRPGLARLIDDAVISCDYDLCLLASGEGKRRFANVRKLMRMADDFEALEGPDPAGFVELVRSMGDLADTEGSAPTLAEGEDVVRIMTVHQSKGLEFPVVVLAGLGSEVPCGAVPGVVVGEDGRTGVFLKGSRHKTYEEADLCWGPAAEIVEESRRKDWEEDIRLLYVAMTRAQQRLVLVGAAPFGGKLDGSRMGGIIRALGIESVPGPGESVRLQGLDAVVAGFAPIPGRESWFSQGEGALSTREISSVHIAEGGDETAGGAGAGPIDVTRRFPGTGAAPQQVSFSSLAAYRRCPSRFYLERLLGLGDLPGRPEDDVDDVPLSEETLLDDDERHAGREVGLLVHALLDQIGADERPPAKETLRDLTAEWIRVSGARMSVSDQERAVALTQAFWSSPAAVLSSRPSAEREVEFFFEHAGTMVTGVMDLLCRDAGPWWIVDYKTNAVEGRTLSELADDYQLQAKIYCIAALKAGAPGVRMDFVFLERPEEPVTAHYHREHVSALEGELDLALQEMRSGELAPRPGTICGRCPVAGLCACMTRP